MRTPPVWTRGHVGAAPGVAETKQVGPREGGLRMLWLWPAEDGGRWGTHGGGAVQVRCLLLYLDLCANGSRWPAVDPEAKGASRRGCGVGNVPELRWVSLLHVLTQGTLCCRQGEGRGRREPTRPRPGPTLLLPLLHQEWARVLSPCGF